MLNICKWILKRLARLLGYELRLQKTFDLADDPVAIIRLLSDCDEISVIVDGGASIGDTSERFACMFPKAKVYAFEPFPKFLKVLREKALTNSRIRVFSFALGKIEGERILRVNESDGTNSLFAASQTGKELYPELLEQKGEIKVSITNLDEWAEDQKIDQIDILKLDLQGGELAALQGVSKNLKERRIKFLIVEISFLHQYENQPIASDILKFLECQGYDLFNLYQCSYHNGQIIQADAIFVERTTLAKLRFSHRAVFHHRSRVPL